MMSFQHPEYWWAVFALLIPLLLHLLNKGIKKEVEIGSLNWLEKDDKSVHTNLKFQNALQWLLRSIIFLALLFMLLNPFWEENITIDKKALIVIDQNLEDEAIYLAFNSNVYEQTNLVFNNYNLSEFKLDFKEKHKSYLSASEVLKLIKTKKTQPKSLTLIGTDEFLQFEKDSIFSSFPITLKRHKEEIENNNSIATINRNGKLNSLILEKSEGVNKILIQQSNEKSSKEEIIDFSSRQITIVYDEESIVLKNQILASLQSLEKYLDIELMTTTIKSDEIKTNENQDFVFWISKKSNKTSIENMFIQNDKLRYKQIVKLNEREKLVNFNGDTKNETLPYFLAQQLFENESINQKVKALTKQNELPKVIVNKTESNNDNTIAHSMMFPLTLLLLLFFLAERLLNYKLSNE